MRTYGFFISDCRTGLGGYDPFHFPGERDWELLGDDILLLFWSCERSVSSIRGDSWTMVCATYKLQNKTSGSVKVAYSFNFVQLGFHQKLAPTAVVWIVELKQYIKNDSRTNKRRQLTSMVGSNPRSRSSKTAPSRFSFSAGLRNRA